MKTYLTKDTTIKALKLICKGYYFIAIKPLLFYLKVTFYGRTSPSYLLTSNLFELQKQTNILNKNEVNNKEYKDYLKQKKITETYYNTLQDLKRKTYE